MSTKQDIINHNQKLFRFISPNSNDTLSKMDEKEINELTSLLEDFYLELREDLKIDATLSLTVFEDKKLPNPYFIRV